MEESVVQTNVDDNHQNEKQEQQDSKNKSATQQAQQLPEPDITSSAKGKIFYCLELCLLIHLTYIVLQ